MDSKIIDVMIQAVGQTVYMVFFSTLFASILGFILGIVVTVTSPKGLKPNKIIYNVLDLIINVLRSFPFIILIVFIIPLTRAIVGTPIGEAAAIVPLTIAAAPFVARIIESSLKEVDSGVIEAAKSFGASNTQSNVKRSSTINYIRINFNYYKYNRIFSNGRKCWSWRIRKSSNKLWVSKISNGCNDSYSNYFNNNGSRASKLR